VMLTFIVFVFLMVIPKALVLYKEYINVITLMFTEYLYFSFKYRCRMRQTLCPSQGHRTHYHSI